MPDESGPVLVLYNAPSPGAGESEAGILWEVEAVVASLQRLGVPHVAVGLRDLADLPPALSRHPAHIAINLVEGFQHDPNDMTLVPAVCRAFGVEVTGSDTPCLSLVLDKWKTKTVLAAAGIRCPAGILVPVGQPVPPTGLPVGSCIVKPVAADASEGIDAHSIVNSASPALHDLVRQIHEKFNQPALIEEMVGQRELNISVLQIGGAVQVLPLAEIDFSAFGADRPRIVGYAAKWNMDSFEYLNTVRVIPAPVTPEQADKIRAVALSAWSALGCRDYARVDIRLDDRGEPVVLEVNPNPDISQDDGYVDAGFPAALSVARISYDQFVQALLDNVNGRQPTRPSAAPVPPTRSSTGSLIRHVAADDRDAVLTLLAQPRFFRPDEIVVGQEVLDDSIRDGAGGHYQSFVIEDGGRIVGWVCFGPTPCAVNTYDIYWIAVAGDCQRRGFGKALMEFAEASIRQRGGRIAVIETSSRDDYVPTRAFYAKAGYVESARVREFYAPGDDKIISMKSL